MSSVEEDTPRVADTSAIHVSIPRIDTPTDTTPIGLTTKPTRREVIITLAMLRGEDNKHMFSANKIADLVGGAHNDTMRLVKEVREGRPDPVYRDYPGELAKFAEVANGHEE